MSLPDRICAQASGSRTAEAAAYLVIRCGLLDHLSIDDHPSHGLALIDWEHAAGLTAVSGGERCLIAIAASLAAGAPLDLSDVLTGLDYANSRHLVRAIAHALDAKELLR